MYIDAHFLEIARAAFNPYLPDSGTEHVAPFLYSMARMTRANCIVEYGSGYTTLFLLAALAENASDFQEESSLLRAKTIAASDPRQARTGHGRQNVTAWYQAGGKACGADPGYYLGTYVPQLYCFEEQSDNKAYTKRMMDAVSELKLSGLLSYFPGSRFTLEALPAQAMPIDLAWNDDHHYKAFFDMFWPKLNPNGGLMIFHNTVAAENLWEEVNAIRAERSKWGDLEILTLAEPHKLNQNGCTIFRRITSYQPSFRKTTRERVLTDLMEFMGREPVALS
jgi:predicted O-methyltransferase YrrM